jgi:hypothetical protein
MKKVVFFSYLFLYFHGVKETKIYCAYFHHILFNSIIFTRIVTGRMFVFRFFMELSKYVFQLKTFENCP